MFDNPIILLIIVVAALLRWFAQRSEKEKEDPERPVVPDQPIPRGGETKTEEERVRRFLEALGHPATSTPPPKVTRKREFQPNKLPPLTTIPPPLPSVPISRVKPPPVSTPLLEEPVFTPAMVQEVGFEVRDLGVQTSSDSFPGTRRTATERQGFLLKLRSAQDLRNAIVLREIFGPPRGLQTPDPVSGF